MAFTVLPAIDVRGGRLARLSGGTVEPVDDHGGDPLAAARAFADAGATWVHLVDLDLAFEGRLSVAPLVRALVEGGLHVQASGAVRGAASIDGLLAAGAGRVVLGAAALADPDAVAGEITRYGPALWLGIEAEGERIRSRGADPVDLPLVPTLGWLTTAGASGFVATAVARVSGLGGPDTALVRRVARSGRPVVAGGGIASLEDLRAVRRAGAVGAIVGRAALEGSMDLAEAFRLHA
jgi:phosphoribosylformimino-5-aminoimidazole carboxamide ribonucleotide (ProFAR) isomerase